MVIKALHEKTLSESIDRHLYLSIRSYYKRFQIPPSWDPHASERHISLLIIKLMSFSQFLFSSTKLWGNHAFFLKANWSSFCIDISSSCCSWISSVSISRFSFLSHWHYMLPYFLLDEDIVFSYNLLHFISVQRFKNTISVNSQVVEMVRFMQILQNTAHIHSFFFLIHNSWVIDFLLFFWTF